MGPPHMGPARAHAPHETISEINPCFEKKMPLYEPTMYQPTICQHPRRGSQAKQDVGDKPVRTSHPTRLHPAPQTPTSFVATKDLRVRRAQPHNPSPNKQDRQDREYACTPLQESGHVQLFHWADHTESIQKEPASGTRPTRQSILTTLLTHKQSHQNKRARKTQGAVRKEWQPRVNPKQSKQYAKRCHKSYPAESGVLHTS